MFWAASGQAGGIRGKNEGERPGESVRGEPGETGARKQQQGRREKTREGRNAPDRERCLGTAVLGRSTIFKGGSFSLVVKIFFSIVTIFSYVLSI